MQPYIIAFGVFALITLLLIVWIFLLQRKIQRLVAGKNGATLEQAIHDNHARIEMLEREHTLVRGALAEVDIRLRKKIDGVRIHRFNPFQGVGGNQSFASAFLDEEKNGVVISTLYSRERVSVFAKPIKKGASEFELTEEEQRVLS